MGFGFEKVKRDFARHRSKAVVLGVLAVVMVVMIVKAYFELAGPRDAAAEGIVENKVEETVQVSAADTEQRMRHSRELWKTLRESRGIDSSVAFTFDSSFYPPDPKHVVLADPDPIDRSPA